MDRREEVAALRPNTEQLFATRLLRNLMTTWFGQQWNRQLLCRPTEPCRKASERGGGDFDDSRLKQTGWLSRARTTTFRRSPVH